MLRPMRILAILLALLAAAAAAAGQTYQGKELVRAELLADTDAIVPGEPFTAGVLLDIEPGWHVYWEYPGDAGAPTTLDWTLPQGMRAGDIQWPVPLAVPEPGDILVYAYKDQVLLLTRITPPSDLEDGEVTLRVRAAWLVCEVVCIPGAAELELTLPVAESASPANAELFDKYHALLPRDDAPFTAQWAFQGGNWEIAVSGIPEGDKLSFFPLLPEEAVAGHPEVTQDGGEATVRIRADAELRGVFVLERNGERLGFLLEPADTDVEESPLATAPGMALAILLAFVGGLILNLMPCVFPVLGIKIMGFVGQAGEERGRVILHGLLYTAGILVSFWVLAGVLLGLRAGGEELGWGFQLQSPAFVYALLLVLFVFGLNMSGVFEIGASATTVGGKLAGRSSLGGSFFAGVLATIVATPCAAPFLATALGAALALPPVSALVLFTFIALGLASPYLVLSGFPALVKYLPRPGQWMETFKQAMAFLLYAAAAYLLWVLEGQIGADEMLTLLIALVFVALACWIYGRWTGFDRSPGVRRVSMATAAVVLALAVAAGYPSPNREIEWIPWSPETVQRLREEGRPVYLDFTARWCATCQTNKRIVFSSREVLDRFKELNVAAVKADWTNHDAAITHELAKWGRSAIPFNLVYLPGETEPNILPELLTPGIVLDALNEKRPRP